MARGPRKKTKPNKRLEPRRGLDARASGDKPRHKPDVRIDKAQQAWEQRRFDEAIRLYERALERDPTNAVLLVDVARAYALRFRFADAEKLADRARNLHPDNAELQRMLGRSYVQLQQFDRAIECYRHALDLEPEAQERAQTLYELAKMYERLHRLDEARTCTEEALVLAPDQHVLRYFLAVVDRRAGQIESAQARLEQLIEAREASFGVIADAWYQLASIHDSAGRFSQAYNSLQHAKKIFSAAAGPMRYDAADVADVNRRTYASVAAEHFARWDERATHFRPLGRGLTLLCSHPRSGTTLLEQVLDSHPEIVSADELEVMSELVYVPLCHGSPTTVPVPAILDAAPQEQVEEARRRYWDAMQGALREPIADRILLDKNPALTGLLPLIGCVFPEMKIIFALRDPRDVVLSCYMQQLPMNPVSVHYLALADTAKNYAATMRLWLKLRAMIRNPWIEVRYEDTVADLERQARRVLEFLGLPWDGRVLDYHKRAQQKHIHSPTYEAVTRPLYTSSIGRWKSYEEQLAPCLEILRPYVEAFGYAD
jgi:tetratricopeptide (TPR) repeat protein